MAQARNNPDKVLQKTWVEKKKYLFKEADKNKDGMLNRQEFKVFCSKKYKAFEEVFGHEVPDLADFDQNYFQLHRFEKKKGVTLKDLETRNKIMK